MVAGFLEVVGATTILVWAALFGWAALSGGSHWLRERLYPRCAVRQAQRLIDKDRRR